MSRLDLCDYCNTPLKDYPLFTGFYQACALCEHAGRTSGGKEVPQVAQAPQPEAMPVINSNPIDWGSYVFAKAIGVGDERCRVLNSGLIAHFWHAKKAVDSFCECQMFQGSPTAPRAASF